MALALVCVPVSSLHLACGDPLHPKDLISTVTSKFKMGIELIRGKGVFKMSDASDRA